MQPLVGALQECKTSCLPPPLRTPLDCIVHFTDDDDDDDEEKQLCIMRFADLQVHCK